VFATGYMFSTISEGRMVVFLKTDRDSVAIIRYSTSGMYIIPAVASEYRPPIYSCQRGSRLLSLEIEILSLKFSSPGKVASMKGGEGVQNRLEVLGGKKCPFRVASQIPIV